MPILEDEKRKELHVLCHVHQEMLMPGRVGLGNGSASTVVYACPKPACQVHYSISQGYFMRSENGHALVTDSVPFVQCEYDKIYMYLAEVLPEKRSFRLWKCPKCKCISAINA
jgi:hypothetical protein